MKLKNKLFMTIIMTLLVLFLRVINVLQYENKLAYPFSMMLMIVFLSVITIYIQENIDHNYQQQKVYYQNLNILKYILSILVIILHLRPFIHYSNELDLAFNNIVSRISVPLFFIITGYFVAKKEKEKNNYIDTYIKRTIPLYLMWSLIYIPIILMTMIQYLPQINEYIIKMNISMPLLILLIIVLLPIVLIVMLCYSGVYYHLWYFPALMLSLFVLKKWKEKYKLNYLFIISFFLLLFGATETYYGLLPLSIKELVTYYFNIFFTTRNFLFFGLFYVILGYKMGLKDNVYSKNCFVKFIISCFFLIFEAIILHDFHRLDSNILLSCIPVTYYLFISIIYITNHINIKVRWNQYSKYYYLLHPMMIFIVSFICKDISQFPLLNIVIVLVVTHIISLIMVQRDKKKVITIK